MTREKRHGLDSNGEDFDLHGLDDRQWKDRNTFSKAEMVVPENTVIDLSAGWDSDSYLEEFNESIKKHKWYRDGLLYSGFDGDDDGFTSPDGGIWCYGEEKFKQYDMSPLDYALRNEKPAMAIYDPEKMESTEDPDRYIMTEQDALVARLSFKFS